MIISRSWLVSQARRAALFAGSSLLLLSPAALADDSAPPDGRQLFERHCIACHTLDKATSQRLDRTAWEWVIDDMISYGLSGLSGEEREKIVDYLVENYGRDVPR